MPDLHGWITQQIDNTAAHADRWHDTECAVHDTSLIDATVLQGATLCDCGGPAAVVRRCAADRKILARHRLDPNAYWADAAMCQGCGDEGEMAYPRTENLNDCPELLDLAYAHGITDEVLATLGRPREGERPEPAPRSLIPDSIAAVYAASLLHAMRTQIITVNTPSPEEKALEILDPELKKIPGYVPVAEES